MSLPRLLATVAFLAFLGAAGLAHAELPSLSSPPTVVTGLTPELEEKVDGWARQAMRLIYEGRPAEAARIVGHMMDAAPDDPRPYLFQARVLRENVSDQNFIRESLKPQLAPIHFELDRCIEISEKILREDPESLHGLLYRGWGKLFKAQLHVLAFEHWSAGRTAKAGKKDLDLVLARDPNNNDAIMVVGTYMYFADSLPGFSA